MREDDTEDRILGLARDSNRLRPYTHRWPELFEAEARAIRAALGALALDVQHVGSTSVPGLAAKPILDIAVAVARLDQYRECIGPLASLGYEHAYWAGIERNEVFGKGIDRTHLAHVVEFRSQEWNNYLKFRDRLRQSPELARTYEQLKRELSATHATSRADYTAAKQHFIRQVLNAA